jgi:hypothetical protein
MSNVSAAFILRSGQAALIGKRRRNLSSAR